MPGVFVESYDLLPAVTQESFGTVSFSTAAD